MRLKAVSPAVQWGYFALLGLFSAKVRSSAGLHSAVTDQGSPEVPGRTWLWHACSTRVLAQ